MSNKRCVKLTGLNENSRQPGVIYSSHHHKFFNGTCIFLILDRNISTCVFPVQHSYYVLETHSQLSLPLD